MPLKFVRRISILELREDSAQWAGQEPELRSIVPDIPDNPRYVKLWTSLLFWRTIAVWNENGQRWWRHCLAILGKKTLFGLHHTNWAKQGTVSEDEDQLSGQIHQPHHGFTFFVMF